MIDGVADRDLFQENVDEELKKPFIKQHNQNKKNYKRIFEKKWVVKLFLAFEGCISSQFFSPILNYIRRTRHFMTYNLREVSKRKCGYCLGMLSCVLVVLAITTTVSVTNHLPIIFFRIAENERGQFDVVIRPTHDYGHTLNFTEMVKTIKNGATTKERLELYELLSPRIVFSSTVYSHKSCKLMDNGQSLPIWDHDGTNKDKIQWMYGYNDYTLDNDCTDGSKRYYCPSIKCPDQENVLLVAFDTKKENKMGFGRDWEYSKLEMGECVISTQLANDLRLSVGDELILQSNLFSHKYSIHLGMLQEIGLVDADSENEVDWGDYKSTSWQFFIPLKIAGIETDRYLGKNDMSYLDGATNAVFVEFETLYSHIGRYIDRQFDASTQSKMMGSSPYSYASYIYLNHPDRVNLYNSNNFQNIRKRVTAYAGEFLYLTGFDQIDSEYPLLMFLRGTRMISLFLSLIINIIIAILTGLSVILIYSLLMINVEERTFEMGVLRMVGLKLGGMIEMILMQSLMYSAPGILFGLVIGEIVYLLISFLLRYFLNAFVPYFISIDSILIAIILGVLIPLVGSIIPIRRAMKKSLNDSLDTRRSKVKAVVVKIERLTDTSVSWSLLILSVSSFGFGFFIYYFFPLAMITQQFNLLLTLFFGIILMMLIGCILLALNLESIIQSFLTHILFFWEFTSVKKIIVKNLIAHKTRNRKTTIMYSISLGFLIFVAVSTRLEIKMYEFTNRRIFGTDFVIETNYGSSTLNNDEFLADFDNFVESEKNVDDYAYITYSLSYLTNDSAYYVRTIGDYYAQSTDLQGISPNFFEVLDKEFLIVSKQNNDFRGWGVSEQLYNEFGTFGIMGGKGEWKDLGLKKLDENVIYCTEKPTEQFKIYQYKLMRYNSVLDSGAGSTFSKYDESVVESRLNSEKYGHDGFVSLPSLMKMIEHEKVYQNTDDIPIRFIYLKLSDGNKISAKEHERIKLSLIRMFSKHGMDVVLTDVAEVLERIEVVDDVLSIFFYLATTLAMLMCFFSLISNMVTNVQDQSKEIGILRSIGCRKCTLRRIYVYESLIIIYTSGVIGTVIGSFIGYTLVLQQQLFTQLPLGFVLPYEIIIIVVITGIVCGFCASICPINILLRNSPVQIMRKVY